MSSCQRVFTVNSGQTADPIRDLASTSSPDERLKRARLHAAHGRRSTPQLLGSLAGLRCCCRAADRALCCANGATRRRLGPRAHARRLRDAAWRVRRAPASRPCAAAVAAGGRAAPGPHHAGREPGGCRAGAGPRALRRVGGSMAESPREEPPSGPESEAELSQRLALIKARSYGSTASVAAPLAERYVEHRLSPGDTLQGIALKYGVTMEQIKRANKLFTNDCIFLRKTLSIPVISEKPLLFNGLNSLESPENETVDSSPSCEEGLVTVQEESSSSPSPQEPDNQPTAPEELSAKDFLQRLDLQIKLSKQAARKLKDDSVREEENEEGPYATSSYHQ